MIKNRYARKVVMTVTLVFALLLPLATTVTAATISTTDKYVWSETSGWLNFNPTHAGLTIYGTHLAGYAWGENVGWIKLGADSGGPYVNTTVDNWGVNKDGGGNLSGYGWSENVGWINFNPTDSQVVIDPDTGKFSGYAWAENIGWIHFDHPAFYGLRRGNDVPVNTTVPIISGTALVGNTLNSDTGAWTDADGDTLTYVYQWYRADDNSGTNETVISGAMAADYIVTENDAHKYLRAVVTADDGHGSNDQTASSAWLLINNSAPTNSAVPTISGTHYVGNTLTSSSGNWNDTDGDTPTYTYQWYRADDNSSTNETVISGAMAADYIVTENDAHKYLRAVVTADDGHGSNDQTASSAWLLINNSAPTNSAVPIISGTAKIGNTLTSSTGIWTDADGDTPTFSFQWKANGTNISGETFSTFILVPAQGHATITCTVIADDGHGWTTSATTAGVLVENSAPTFTGTPTITGIAKVGKTLSLADTNTSDADGDTITLSYQWAADGVDIVAAILDTFQLTSNEAKKTITCSIIADDGNGGVTTAMTSAVEVKSFPWWSFWPVIMKAAQDRSAQQQ